MYLNAHIQVLINGHPLESVVSVHVKNDGNHIGSSCDIVIPMNARIGYNVTTGFITQPSRLLFNTGDHIIINAKYDGYESFGTDGDWIRVFEGFIYEFYESTPLKIKCIDYIYWFNIGIYGTNYVYTKDKGRTIKGGVGKSWPKSKGGIDFSDLLQDVVNWVNGTIYSYNIENVTNFSLITLIRPQFTFHLENIQFSNMSPASVLEYLKKELGFNISMNGTKLYANVASNTVSEVNLDTRYNVIKSALQSTNLTKKRTQNSTGSNSVFTRIKLKAYFENENGTKDSFELGDPNGQLREVFFYKVAKGNQVMKNGKLVYENYYNQANEALTKCLQQQYTGQVETLLYPEFSIFWKVNYTDLQYKERNGSYICTAQEIKIDDNGYHRISKLAFITDLNIVTAANG